MPKIYDCFTFNNEDLLLKLRLETLDPIVDKFVVVEATHTHAGTPRALQFDISRVPRFADKIIHIVVDDMPLAGDAWANERHQRNAILRGLKDAEPSDIVIVSDVDEIPNPAAVLRYRPYFLMGSLRMRLYNYLLNNAAVDEKTQKTRIWPIARVTTFKHLQSFFGTPQNLRHYHVVPGLSGRLKNGIRELRHQKLDEGGWHFSWIMTPAQMIEKFESGAHTEYNVARLKDIPAIESAIRNGTDVVGKGGKFRLVPVDDSFPPYLLQNFELFRDWCRSPELRRQENG